MKKNLLLFAMLFVFSAAMMAQNKTEVLVKIVENGKIVQDTTFSFKDIESAKKAVEMVDMMHGHQGCCDAEKMRGTKMMMKKDDGGRAEIDVETIKPGNEKKKEIKIK